MTERRKNKILVSIDFQEESYAALKQSYQVAKFLKAELVLLHVFELPDLLHSLFVKHEELVKVTAETVTKLNNLVAQATEESGLMVTSRFETGKAYVKIVEIAKEVGARLIIMGKSSTELRHKMGSNTIHVVGGAPCPVITLKNSEHRFDFKNVVMPLDLTKPTAEQTAMAIALGRYFNSTIHIVSVLTGGIFLHRSRIYGKMVRVEKELVKQGITTKLKLYPKTSVPAYKQILKYSNDHDIDLIMLLARQDTSPNDQYLGAVAQHIINEADIPVLSLIPADNLESESALDTFWNPFDLF